MPKIIYNKLVRDRIPEIIEKSDKQVVTAILDDTAYKKLLDEKLVEELQEYLDSDKVEELADLVEVIYALLDLKNVSLADFESLRWKKAQERGAFRKRIFLQEVIED